MSVVARVLQPSIGRKAVMAATGIVLYGFVIVHMLGNLQVLLGPAKYNAYAAFLQSLGGLLWIARGVLLVCVGLHIWAAVTLALQKRAARPAPYVKTTPQASTYASRTMMLSGPILLGFIIYHVLHYTVGVAHPQFSPTDVYRNFVIGFSNPAVVGVYVVCMAMLGMHLIHGVKSLFQTLGVSTIRGKGVRGFAVATVGLLVAGNVFLPVTVLLGLVK